MARSSHPHIRFLELLQLLRPPRRCRVRSGTGHPWDLMLTSEPGGTTPPSGLAAPDLPPAGDEPWDRLQCLGCGRIIVLRQERLPQDIHTLAQGNDFQDLGHRLLVFGYCPRCQGKRH